MLLEIVGAEERIVPTFIDSIAHFAPWATGEERQLRLRIQTAQAIASARLARERNGRARTLYCEAGATATAWLFRRVDDVEDLKRILRALNQLFIAADNIAQVEGPDGE